MCDLKIDYWSSDFLLSIEISYAFKYFILAQMLFYY